MPFVELDERIEHAAGSSVREIFERDGEARFRELEAAALVEAASHDPSVVSCGGGVVLEPANRVSLRATGEVVFLVGPARGARGAGAARGRASADPLRGRPRAPVP